MPYELRKGDLFKDPPKNTILTHACNAQGRWGRGIALTFRKKYPRAFQQYAAFCQDGSRDNCGRTIIAEDNKLVGCLITSWGWAPPDKPKTIAGYTLKAAKDLISQATERHPGYEIHSCKINAGLFKVPWANTHGAILEALKESGDNLQWVVWEL
jgi:ADP-ribose 1''-phosphate phosphatase